MLHSLCVMMTCHGIHIDMAQVRLAVQYTMSDMTQLVSIPSVILYKNSVSFETTNENKMCYTV